MVFTERFLIKKSIKIFSYLRDLADVEVGQVEEEAPESQWVVSIIGLLCLQLVFVLTQLGDPCQTGV